MNVAAVDKAIEAIIEINYPADWAKAKDAPSTAAKEPEFITKVQRPMLAQKGDALPVSAFTADGVSPTATSQYSYNFV